MINPTSNHSFEHGTVIGYTAVNNTICIGADEKLNSENQRWLAK